MPVSTVLEFRNFLSFNAATGSLGNFPLVRLMCLDFTFGVYTAPPSPMDLPTWNNNTETILTAMISVIIVRDTIEKKPDNNCNSFIRFEAVIKRKRDDL